MAGKGHGQRRSRRIEPERGRFRIVRLAILRGRQTGDRLEQIVHRRRVRRLARDPPLAEFLGQRLALPADAQLHLRGRTHRRPRDLHLPPLVRLGQELLVVVLRNGHHRRLADHFGKRLGLVEVRPAAELDGEGLAFHLGFRRFGFVLAIGRFRVRGRRGRFLDRRDFNAKVWRVEPERLEIRRAGLDEFIGPQIVQVIREALDLRVVAVADEGRIEDPVARVVFGHVVALLLVHDGDLTGIRGREFEQVLVAVIVELFL